jgi:hypothetical protein
MPSTICIDTTTVPNPCIHPFDILFKTMDDIYKSDGNVLSKFEILSKLLKDGILIPSCNMCCPNCGDTYLLMGNEVYKVYNTYTNPPAIPVFGAVETVSSGDNPCCLNTYMSVETYLKYAEAVGLTQAASPLEAVEDGPSNSSYTNCCDTKFTECIDNFVKWFGEKYSDDYSLLPTHPYYAIRDFLRDLGIVEVDSLGEDQLSGICKLIELFSIYDLTSGLTAQQFIQSYINLFFSPFINGDGGVIVKCYSDGMTYIGQVQSFINYNDSLIVGPPVV